MADVTKYQLVPNNNNNNNFLSLDIKSATPLSLLRPRKSTTAFVYGVVLAFVVFTILLAFIPSNSSSSFSSPWFINIFTLNSTSSSPQPSSLSSSSHINLTDSSTRSYFPSILSHFFPNSTQTNTLGSQNNTSLQIPTSQNLTKTYPPPDKAQNFTQTFTNDTSFNNISPKQGNLSVNTTKSQLPFSENPPVSPNNSTETQIPPPKDQNLTQSCSNGTCKAEETQGKQNNVSASASASPEVTRSPNVTVSPVGIVSNSSSAQQLEGKVGNLTQTCKNEPCKVTPQISQQLPSNSTVKSGNSTVKVSDFAASLSKKKENNNSSSSSGVVVGGNNDVNVNKNDLVGSLVNCDLYDGSWVRDESYPLYKPGSCPILDEQFQCLANGRPDQDFHKLKWQPKSCSLPRLDGGHMLNLLKGKRLVFVGDSLNRNMWESLVCILRNSVKNKKNVYEKFGRHSFRSEASYAFVFKDYNCTIEFFVAPFLVRQHEIEEKKGAAAKETLRLDLMAHDAPQFKDADFLIFNTGHWWTHDKLSKGEDYYQEGSNVYKQLDVEEAFRKAMTTWGRWIDRNVNPMKTHVFFRGYSASHFSGGQWNSGGSCDSETEPIRNDSYLAPYPWKMQMLEKVVKGMKTPVSYLNVTKMSDYRKDGHPSRYRKQHAGDLQIQDCSHWCLPGVPDSWNELLYAELLRKQ